MDDGCLDGPDQTDQRGGDAEDVDDADADKQVLFDGAVGRSTWPPPSRMSCGRNSFNSSGLDQFPHRPIVCASGRAGQSVRRLATRLAC